MLVSGRSVGEKIGAGPVARDARRRTTRSSSSTGEVLVTDMTDPDWEPVMKKAAAIVTDRGGRTCHAAIVSRELGLPASSAPRTATTALHDGQDVTVSCAEGEDGLVYDGRARLRRRDASTSADLPRPRTQVMMNVGNPERRSRCRVCRTTASAWRAMEFIISSAIQVHPLALLDSDRSTTRAAQGRDRRG